MADWTPLTLGAILEHRYEIVALLGRGGFGATYRAVDRRRLGAPCAVKELLPPPAARTGPAFAAAAERFEREARALLRLRHDAVPRLHAFFEQDGRCFLVQDLVEGHSLHQLLDDAGPFEEDAVRAIVAQVLDILVYLHGHAPPVVHRDIKPANVILDPQGRAHLVDFGAVRDALEAGGPNDVEGGSTRVGTPGYAPFEQIMGRVVPTSDLYAVGATAVTLLTGVEPLAWLGRHDDSWTLDGRTGASPAFERFLARLLADLPARFPTASAARAALAALDVDEAQPNSSPLVPNADSPAAPPDVPRPRWPAGRRVRVAAALGALAAAATGAFAWHASAAGDAPLDRQRVTVFPLVASGAPAAAPALGEDVATVLAAALDDAGPLRAVDGWRLLDARARADVRTLDAAAARALARARGSAYYLTGRVARRGDSADVSLELTDVAGDSVVAAARAAGPAADAWQTALRAMTRLMPALVPGGASGLTAEWESRHPAAVAHFLAGEAALRRGRARDALVHYHAAVARDSGFVVAALRGAEAATAAHDDDQAATLVRVVLRPGTARTLPPRWLHLARGQGAYADGRADSAVRELGLAVRADPSLGAAWVALGEVYAHLLPAGAGGDSLADAAFARARQLDTASAILLHPILVRLRAGDTAGATPLLRRFLAAGPDTTLAGEAHLTDACVRRGPAGVDWRAAVARDPLAVLGAAHTLAAGGAHPACAAAAYTGVLDADAGAAGADASARTVRQWSALVGLQGVLIAEGRGDAAAARIDTAVRAGLGGAALLLAEAPVVPAFAPAAARMAASDARDFGAAYERCPYATRLWALGLWAAHAGRPDLAATIARHLRTVTDPDDAALGPTLADLVDARVVLARGDTAGAIARLTALTAAPARANDLAWDLATPRAGERLLLAQLLLARGDAGGALQAATVIDAVAPAINPVYLPASLDLRARAADALGQRALAAQFRARLAALGAGPRLAVR